MSLPETTLRRLPKIKAGLLEGKTSQEIAIECGVRRETIERDKRSWRESGELEDWVKEEAIRLHYLVVKKHPVDAYREVMRLLGKTLVQRIEAKEQIDIRQIIVKKWQVEENESTRSDDPILASS